MLEGFEPLRLVTGIPTMSITKNGVSFNKTSIEKLGCPPYVIPMIDRQGNRFAIVARDERDDDTRKFHQEGRDTSNGIRWNNNDLVATFENMMGWKIAYMGMKVMGKYSENDKAIIFNLESAEPIDSGSKKGKRRGDMAESI